MTLASWEESQTQSPRTKGAVQNPRAVEYLPLERIQGVHADIDEDGSLRHIAQCLESADCGDP